VLARDARRLRSLRLTALPSILANEKNNAKFNFLVPGDPYHAYYEQKARSRASFCTAALIPPLRAARWPSSAQRTAKRSRSKCALLLPSTVALDAL
jgi:hypothetical protein